VCLLRRLGFALAWGLERMWVTNYVWWWWWCIWAAYKCDSWAFGHELQIGSRGYRM